LQQSPRQQRLHIPAAIDNEVDVNTLTDHAVDDPVWFEDGLAVFANTKREQLLRVAPAFGKRRQRFR
jgi:hypothetical protein